MVNFDKALAESQEFGPRSFVKWSGYDMYGQGQELNFNPIDPKGATRDQLDYIKTVCDVKRGKKKAHYLSVVRNIRTRI